MSAVAIFTLRVVLIAATAMMFALHLVSAPLLRRGVRAVTLLRWEMAYYALLIAALFVPEFHRVLIPALVLAALHFGTWAYTELRPTTELPSPGLLRAVQGFDSAEALVLVWIAVTLALTR